MYLATRAIILLVLHGYFPGGRAVSEDFLTAWDLAHAWLDSELVIVSWRRPCGIVHSQEKLVKDLLDLKR